MHKLTREFVELVAVLLTSFLVIVLFVIFSPSIFSSNVMFPIKMLYELSPFIILVAIVYWLGKRKKSPITSSLGFQLNPFVKQILIGIGIFAITISFVIIPLLAGVDKTEVLNFKARSPMILTYYLIKAMIFAGIGEELVWRGYVYGRLKEITGVGMWAVVFSSILFGLWHFPNGQNILQVIMTTGLGMIYGFARLKVKECSTLATGIAHGLHDAVILLLSYFFL
jgi:uncharacterized protein